MVAESTSMHCYRLHALYSKDIHMCMWGQWSDTYFEVSGYQDPLLTGNRGSSLLAN